MLRFIASPTRFLRQGGSTRTLLRYQLLFGDWKLYLKAKDALNAVTADDIMRFARTYLGTDNKTVAYLVRKAQ